jgi:hypothetical protein
VSDLEGGRWNSEGGITIKPPMASAGRRHLEWDIGNVAATIARLRNSRLMQSKLRDRRFRRKRIEISAA